MRVENLKKGNYRGGTLVAATLETAGITHTFGIPGTHNIELYDALDQSEQLNPILVTDEQSAGFIADGMARSGGPMACANVVPGAGITHLLSGVGEAYMDNVPMLVLSCAIRSDTGHKYQVHDVDQMAIIRPLCKGTFRVERGEDIPLVLLKAVALAQDGCPGPVAVEVPGNLYLFGHPYDPQPVRQWLEQTRSEPKTSNKPKDSEIEKAAFILGNAKQPLFHLGLGASHATKPILTLAQQLGAVVSTTFSGKGSFPESHPQWLWPGFGNTCPSPLRKIAATCDATLILGARMGEVSTGSYGLQLPRPAIQVDIDPSVIGANFEVDVAVESDTQEFVNRLMQTIKRNGLIHLRDTAQVQHKLQKAHKEVRTQQTAPGDPERVHPDTLLRAIQKHFPSKTCYTTDSGKGTFLAMEHLRLDHPRKLLSPTDFSCMGYAIPAAMGAAWAHPGEPVVALAGDGALLMTGLELITAAQHKLPICVFVLNDGELGQISRFQRDITTVTTCTSLPSYNMEALANVADISYLEIRSNDDVDQITSIARRTVEQSGPILVNVAIDYSQKTHFTRGVVKTNFGRLPWQDRLRMVGRVMNRRLFPKHKEAV